MSTFSFSQARFFLNGKEITVAAVKSEEVLTFDAYSEHMQRVDDLLRSHRAIHEPLVRLDDGEMVRVRPMCNVPNCPGGQLASETIRSSWAGRFVACDERVHATFRRHGDGFCLCGHVMHRGVECLSCAVLGELCAKATPCPREDTPPTPPAG